MHLNCICIYYYFYVDCSFFGTSSFIFWIMFTIEFVKLLMDTTGWTFTHQIQDLLCSADLTCYFCGPELILGKNSGLNHIEWLKANFHRHFLAELPWNHIYIVMTQIHNAVLQVCASNDSEGDYIVKKNVSLFLLVSNERFKSFLFSLIIISLHTTFCNDMEGFECKKWDKMSVTVTIFSRSGGSLL